MKKGSVFKILIEEGPTIFKHLFENPDKFNFDFSEWMCISLAWLYKHEVRGVFTNMELYQRCKNFLKELSRYAGEEVNIAPESVGLYGKGTVPKQNWEQLLIVSTGVIDRHMRWDEKIEFKSIEDVRELIKIILASRLINLDEIDKDKYQLFVEEKVKSYDTVDFHKLNEISHFPKYLKEISKDPEYLEIFKDVLAILD